MKKNTHKRTEKQHDRGRVLARVLADELPEDALQSISGGCTGATCTSPDGETDRGTIG